MKIHLSTDEINKKIDIEKFESYWNFGNIPLNRFEKQKTGYINPFLVEKGFFSDIFQFRIDFISKSIKKYNYFQNNKNTEYDIKISGGGKKIKFYLKKKEIDEWIVYDNKEFSIESCNINLVLLILDFFYEIVYTETFDDSVAIKSMDKITGNPLFVALISKLEYLDSLYRIRNENIKSGKDLDKYKDFLNKERIWLNILLDENFYPLFTSSKSVFLNIEDEVSNVIFNTKIGKFGKSRVNLISKERNTYEKNYSHTDKYYDQHIISEISGFFLKRFNIKDSFRTIFPNFGNYTYLFVLFLLILGIFGDLLIDKPFFSLLIPAIVFVFIIYWYITKRINLFKLFLPRLFLGILIGWLSFVMTADLWKDYVIKSWPKIWILDVVLTVVIFFFIFTSIRNRLRRLSDIEIFKRSLFLIIFASAISLFQGLYITQLEASEILSVSGFFKDIQENSQGNEKKGDKEGEDKEPKEIKPICNIGFLSSLVSSDKELNDDNSDMCNYLDKTLESNLKIDCIDEDNIKLCYIWNILLSQFLVAMLIGIVLQLLWEDRPITEPL